jgi:hypothetical protein
MVNSLSRLSRRLPALKAVLTRLADWFTTSTEEDVDEPTHLPEPVPVAPATFEMRFMRLQSEGRFDEMWEMLADDAQRAWGSRDAFIRGMPRLDEDMQLVDMHVISVTVLDGWTDRLHERSYQNVAQMVMRYRVRQQWREWTFDREVHLIPSAGAWRTLCYPAKSKAGSAVGTR